MPTTCVIVGCTNRGGKCEKSFYRLPKVVNNQGIDAQTKSERRRRLWLAAINRSNPGQLHTIRICSDHFMTGKPHPWDETDPDWVPNKNLGYCPLSKSPTLKAIKCHNRLKNRKETAKKTEAAVSMPRVAKARIGRRTKNYQRKKAEISRQMFAVDTSSADHSYASVTLVRNAEMTSEKCWGDAWNAFFIDTCEEPGIKPAESSQTELRDSDGSYANEFYVLVGKMFQYNPHDNLDDIVEGIIRLWKYNEFQALREDLVTNSAELGLFSLLRHQADIIHMVVYYTGHFPALKFAVVITPDLKASIYAHSHRIAAGHDFWIGFPQYLSTVKDVQKLLSKLSSYSVCAGNYEDKFKDLSIGVGNSSSSSVSAYREYYNGAIVGEVLYNSTIRSTSCLLMTNGETRCSHCNRYRATLRCYLRRNCLSQKQNPINTFSHKTHKHMSRSELVAKLESMKHEKLSVQSELDRLKSDARHTVKQRGHSLSASENIRVKTHVYR